MTSLEQAKTIVKVLDKKKGKDIKLVEIKNLSSLGDYFVIASATSTTQVKSLADEVEEEMTKLGFEPNRVEGRQSAQWILMDYYDVMVHVFLEDKGLMPYSRKALYHAALCGVVLYLGNLCRNFL